MRDGDSSALVRWEDFAAEAVEETFRGNSATMSCEIYERLLWLMLTLHRHQGSANSPAVTRMLSSTSGLGGSGPPAALTSLARDCLAAEPPIPRELAESLAAVRPDSSTRLGMCCELVLLSLSTYPLNAVRLLVSCVAFAIDGTEDTSSWDILQRCVLETLSGRGSALPVEAIESLAGVFASHGFIMRCGKVFPCLLRGLTAHLSRIPATALARDPLLPLYESCKQIADSIGAQALQAVAAASILANSKLAANGHHTAAVKASIAALEVVSSELGAVDAYTLYRLLHTAAVSGCREGKCSAVIVSSAVCCEWAVLLEFERMRNDSPLTTGDLDQSCEEPIVLSDGDWRRGATQFAALVRRLHMTFLRRGEGIGVQHCVSVVKECLRYINVKTDSLRTHAELLAFCLLHGSVTVIFHCAGMLGLVEEQMILVESGFRCLSYLSDPRLRAELSVLLGEHMLLVRVMGSYYNVAAMYSFDVPGWDREVKRSWFKDCATKADLLVESTKEGQVMYTDTDLEAICGTREASRALKAAMCIAASRLSMVLLAHHPSAMNWAKKALGQVVDSPLCSLYRLEAVILVAETYDQVGFVEGALSYLGEASSQVREGPLYLQLTVHVHAKRIWRRMDSPRALAPAAHCACGEKPTLEAGMVWLALESLINAFESNDANDLNMCSWFRHFSKLWNERLQFVPVTPSVLPKLPMVCLAQGKAVDLVSFAGSKPLRLEELGSLALDMLRLLPSTFCGFDLLRSLRRRAAVDLVFSGSAAVDAFILASLSCGTSSECLSFVQHSESEISSLLRSERDGTVDLTKLKAVLRDHSDTLTLAVYEKSARVILLGSYTQGSCMMVGIQCGSDIDEFMANWAETVQRNKDLLRATSEAECVMQWSNEEKRRWWREREAIDEHISQQLGTMEGILGPWRFLLSGARPQPLSAEFSNSLFTALHVSCEDESRASFIKDWAGLVLSNSASGCLSQSEATTVLRSAFGAVSNLGADALELLISRLLARVDYQRGLAGAKSESGHQDSPERIALSKLKVLELRAMLKEKSERTVGKKDELVSRLLTVLSREKENIDPNLSNGHSSKLPDSFTFQSSVLMLDEFFQPFPLEQIPSLSTSNITRLPGLYILLKLKSQHSDPPPLISVFQNSCWYLVDPENNLPSTQQSVIPSMQQFIDNWGWDGFVATAPSDEDFR